MTQGDVLLYGAPLLPLVLTLLAAVPQARRLCFESLPFAPLLALAAALVLPAGAREPFPQILLGSGLVLDETGRVFLGVSAVLWSLGGLYARVTIVGRERVRFAGFWLATATGNFLLFVAADVVTFYVSFALLSLAAFGLVVHTGSDEARRAGRIYLALAVFGETCLLLGLLIGVDAAGSIAIADVQMALATMPRADLAFVLLAAGFGLKAGLMPLHVWLPLAHPAAPVPASAVLSGAIVKAGIFGFVRFLPFEMATPGWGTALVASGLATAYLGALFGVVQRRPKTVLAYSTASQMGLLIAVLGAGLGTASARSVIGAATLHAAHHALAKGALFFSAGVFAESGRRVRGWILGLAALAGLAIAGLPFTGGALAKLALKNQIGGGPVEWLVAASGIGTTLLVLRFLDLEWREAPTGDERPHFGRLLPLVAAVALAVAVPWTLFVELSGLSFAYVATPSSLWSALWPMLVAGAGFIAVRRWPFPRAISIPEGDLVVPCERAFEALRVRLRQAEPLLAAPPLDGTALLRRLDAIVGAGEKSLGAWSVACALLLLIAGVMAVATLA